MTPTRRNALNTLILATSSALVAASPVAQVSALSSKVDTNMPFLSTSAPAASAASQWTQPTVWWTPEASQSEWNWSTWGSSKAASTPSTAVASPTSAASSHTSAPYSNPFTIYTSMTNSAGVITGMPAVVTSQPTQASVVTVCSGCSSVLSNEASWKSSVAALSTTAKVASASTTASTLSTSTVSASGSASSTGFRQVQSTGAAPRSNVAGSGVALLVFGAFAALL